MSRTIQTVSVTTDLEPGGAVASTSARQDISKVELTPLLGLTQQFAIQVEQEIQKQIQERSCQIVQDVLQRSANWIMPQTPSEAVRASLSQCFQKALATPRTEPAPPPEAPRGQLKGQSVKYSLANPFAGINPPPLETLKESNPDHPNRGRATTRLEWPPEEKKRGSSSRPRGEVEPSTAAPVVLNPPGMFLRLGVSSLTKLDLNLQVNWRLGHSEISPDTVLMLTIDRAPKVLVVPTGVPEGMTGGPTRARQNTILKEAWALN